MRDTLIKLQELFLIFLIITLPLMEIPKRFSIPGLGQNIPGAILLISIMLLLLFWFKTRRLIIPHVRYIELFLAWYVLCLLVGAWKFPFYDHSFFEFLRTNGSYTKLINLSPQIFGDEKILILKYTFFQLFSLFKTFLLPLLGLWIIINQLYKNNWQRGLHKIGIGATILTVIMTLYSIPEIIWLLTGNETCKNLLISINTSLYDPKIAHNWWPPLLWEGQLRSMAFEPSFFCIIASFLFPCLWYRYFLEKKKWMLPFILIFTIMLFFTKARTGILVYIGEIFVMFLLAAYVGNKAHFIVTIKTIIISVIAFLLFIGGSMVIPGNNSEERSAGEMASQYFENNVTSAVGAKRSNVARLGNTIALINTGIDYPVFGVGYGYQTMYMKDRFPEFAEDDPEVNNWINLIDEKGFMNSGFPTLNQYAQVFAVSGVIGLILFMVPTFYLVIKLLKNKKLLQIPGILILSVMVAGQVADLLSNAFFLTYPIALSLLYAAIKFEEGKN